MGRMNKRTGFTIVELMIVVANLGLISAIALSAYSNYIHASKTAMLTARYDDARRFVRVRYALAASQVAQGSAATVPDDPTGWIAIIADGGATTPSDGPMYVHGAGDPATGAVGIQVSGTFMGGDSMVTVSRPAFGELPAEVTLIQMDS